MNFSVYSWLRRCSLALLAVIGLLATTLRAQVLAPDFLCVSNDTLQWAPVINNCGPFAGYLVFGSTQPNGPYSLLTTVTNPSQTSFFHAAANGQTWYYYLQSDHNCPGQTRLSSDTLDNRIPLMGNIRRASVEGGGVVLAWEASTSPETFAYVISRSGNMGTVIVDTVFGANNLGYTDFGAMPSDRSETYFIVALDPCGNKSLVGQSHSTVFTTLAAPTACQAAIGLSWSAYTGWSQGVARYEIFATVNGGAPVLVGQANTTTFSYTQVNDGENVCMYVEAVANGTGDRARSNERCTVVDITQPLRNIDLLAADVTPTGEVVIEWSWNPSAIINAANANRFRPGNDAAANLGINLTTPLNALNTLTDVNPPITGGLEYVVVARDECGNTITSNSVFTLSLRGQASGDGFNRLQWDAYQHDLLTGLAFELVKVSATGNETVVYTGGPDVLSYDDPIDPLNSEECCYYLRARINLTAPDGKTFDRTVRSSRVCLSQPVLLYVPNVFAPNGINRIFKPQTPTQNLESYSMNIYDRWGGLVFTSDNIDLGWNGDRGQEVMPQGVYLYHIVVKQANGQSLEKTGTVALIR
jgi:gliding motility-associated-like protein